MERLSIEEDVAADREEEEKRQRAYSHASVGSLSLLLVGMMALMAYSHREAPLWLVSELCAVLCLLLYLWAYHLTQNLTAGGEVVPVEALVFSFPLVFGAGFLAALLAVAVGPLAGVLLMVINVTCTSCFFGFCFAESMRYSKPPVEHKKRV
nr:unnamed protein product [Digitaria exilis]